MITLGLCDALAQERSDSAVTRLFPSRRLVGDFVADGTAHRFSAARRISRNEVTVSVGGIIPLMDYYGNNLRLQVSMGASIFARLDPGKSIAVLSTEFAVDFFLVDVEWSEGFCTRVGMGHASHHLGDGTLKADTSARSVDYSRDYISFFFVRSLSGLEGQIYAGINYGYDLVIDRPVHRPVILQAGLSGAVYSFSAALSLYAGIDVKLRQELGFGSTRRYELGLRYFSPTERSLRLSVYHKEGLDERGQFLGQQQTETGIGIAVTL